MQLEHSFSVPVGIDQAWRILIDIERIGPCMPGASIDSVDGDDFTGTVKVKLGPINLTYKGKASFVEKDESTHRAVIDARGRDSRGNGTASAKVTATLDESGGRTTVHVNTDLDITGKPAQFGRGVMVDVGNKLIGQFADRLSDLINAGDTPVEPVEPAAEATSEAAPEPAADAPTAPAEQAAPAKRSPRPKPARSVESEPAAASETPDVPGAETDAAGNVSVPDAGGEEATPSYSVPGGVPTAASEPVSSVNGHGGRPAREVEPINLLENAGPAVAKRLAPVAVGLVVVLLAIRRHSRRGA